MKRHKSCSKLSSLNLVVHQYSPSCSYPFSILASYSPKSRSMAHESYIQESHNINTTIAFLSTMLSLFITSIMFITHKTQWHIYSKPKPKDTIPFPNSWCRHCIHPSSWTWCPKISNQKSMWSYCIVFFPAQYSYHISFSMAKVLMFDNPMRMPQRGRFENFRHYFALKWYNYIYCLVCQVFVA
jgi:hypothetical protein